MTAHMEEVEAVLLSALAVRERTTAALHDGSSADTSMSSKVCGSGRQALLPCTFSALRERCFEGHEEP